MNYNVGDLVFGHFGWQSHSICDGNPAEHRHGLYKIDPAIPLPDSTALGILGMPG